MGLQIEFCRNWNKKFPVVGKIKGKTLILWESSKKDMYQTKLAIGAILTGGQLQLEDAAGNQYWAYYYKKHERDEYPFIIDEIREV